jgi:ABC-type dipeptide/oligopeptide/nickel transport system permease component
MVVQGGILLLGFLVALVNMAVDVLYGVIDPRIALR